jgi:hypothetical protein
MGSEEFDEKFWVKADQEAAARQFFSRPMMQYFVEQCKWPIEIDGRMMLIVPHINTLKVEGFEEMREFLAGVLKILEEELEQADGSTAPTLG